MLVTFIVCGVAGFRNAQADDLASSYVGCRLVAEHHADHLYSYSPSDFAAVGEDEPGNAWQDAADEGNFEGFLHPYVQTPLWAYTLKPLCMRTQFHGFAVTFVVLSMFAFAAFLWLVVRFWAPSYDFAGAYALLALGLWFSEPFRYAMMLVQTHILLMLLTVAGLVLAERRRPMAAGLLLALAATVKITPAILVVYWLLTRRYKAAASMAGWSAALMGLTLMTTGPEVLRAYFADLHRISHVLLLSQNNQSFAAWGMGHFYPRSEIAAFHLLPLPDAMRLGSAALMVAMTALGGWIDRNADAPDGRQAHLGAAMGLVAATIFAPIAWTHYSFILIVPIMALIQANQRWRSVGLTLVTVVIGVLNFHPFASNVEAMEVGRLALVRGQFFAGALCLAGLAAVAWVERGGARSRTIAERTQRKDLSGVAA